uniref:Large ribosomal subunit protein uL4c n=1 Tax=Wrangelia sp. TaxID=2575620 RepID=A0A4D6WZN5_9FLOR|nr:ribosomal protein L4 [Wrangelia sp.]
MIINQQLTYNIQPIKNDNVNSKISSLSIDLKIYNNPQKSAYLIHKVLKSHLYQNRQGTANTKTRSEVRGGGKKPWKQKGTGRARAGSKNSPLWKGGGVTFGPKSKHYSCKTNKKEKKLALQNILYNKFEQTTLVENLVNDINKPNTKEFLNRLNQIGLNISSNHKILLIVKNKTHNLYLSIRNIPNIDLIAANNLNILSLLKSDTLIITQDGLQEINNIYIK